jgi:hypothetical protein
MGFSGLREGAVFSVASSLGLLRVGLTRRRGVAGHAVARPRSRYPQRSGSFPISGF